MKINKFLVCKSKNKNRNRIKIKKIYKFILYSVLSCFILQPNLVFTLNSPIS